MRKFSKLISTISLGLVFLSSASFAHADLCPTGRFSPLCTLKLENASDITGNIVTVLLVAAIVISLIFLVLGGIRWAMSAGDKQKLETAKQTITGAIIGLVVSLSAYFVLSIILYLFTGESVFDFSIPTIVP